MLRRLKWNESVGCSRRERGVSSVTNFLSNSVEIREHMDTGATKVLLIEDNQGDARLVREMLTEAGDNTFKLEWCGRLTAGLQRLITGDISIVLLDLGLPDCQGLEGLKKIRRQARHLPVVLFTGLADEALGIEAIASGAQDYLVKGKVDAELLAHAIRYATERKRMEEELRRHRDSLEELVKEQTAELTQNIKKLEKEITRRKRLEKRWQDSLSNFQNVVNNTADGIIITDRKGIVRFVNPASESLFGKKSEDFKGEQFGFPISSGDTTEIDILRKAGEITTAEMRVAETVWYDDSAYLVALRDVTERKQAQQAQERLSQQLQAQVSELEAFSYGIAHDLKSPLVSIEGLSRLLQEDMQNQMERVPEDIRLLQSGVRKMRHFLEKTLEYSRAGYQVKLTKNVPFGKIVNEVLEQFGEQLRSIGATISLAETFPRVCVDSMRISQVLTNLLQNSINYRDKTRPLKIEIGHWLSGHEVVFFVRDNGTGIDANNTGKVFELFYRGTAEGEGSGMGLAIVKRIIEAHGGSIWVQQGQSRKGTTMCFTLPQQNTTNKGDNNGKG